MHWIAVYVILLYSSADTGETAACLPETLGLFDAELQSVPTIVWQMHLTTLHIAFYFLRSCASLHQLQTVQD